MLKEIADTTPASEMPAAWSSVDAGKNSKNRKDQENDCNEVITIRPKPFLLPSSSRCHDT